ncbi:bifunctional 4-hydroxy-2-oxoglutarate aldolase/2-dehydro-3-deoxy-phosphogluconate aldolase [Solwaraspora sp. WMMD1047]|uniref:bifunctional 4-hydroxy-2-oxoglutarate aldolase/2-dehydro-3-deoxy-phosphogluconate aldolase n=1 Tax=Solwaraspora sp. WMMD1047 TaxID=3016102 RepID=UPI0024178C44|nr:bifunctional 4-hydroxy-2-oxoglutarate aldolase/2-dehydro-3-deoxy-phosphogluconate aldolase [Solwaraspora sp. WMMD1047]MDG4830146.1 bifunctional 4-hydroxy-2-oxoglutarate aldolase/2-dehydro-3-deoxy-phosphogluconate aldolase [Solwaraspora sp. WMMD1047]
MNLRETLSRHRLLAVVRGDDPDAALRSILTLAEAGITLIEVSLTARDAIGVLVRARAELGPDAPLGAGTVLTEADVVQVEQAGVSFVVLPGLAPAVAECVRLGLPALVGALTPTEVVTASLAGASAVKLFPASLGGVGYLRTLREPFPDVPFVPFGGIDVGLAAEYLAAGALAVGVGGPLLGDAPRGGDLAALRTRAAAFRAAVA